jgi:hypothetical protein
MLESASPGVRAIQRAYEGVGAWTLLVMPFSNLFMSWGVMALAVVGLIDFWDRRRTGRGTQALHTGALGNRPLWVLPLAFFAWQALGLCWTDDLRQGWAVLRMQLPLVIFPLVWLNGRVDVEGWKRRWPIYFASGVALACVIVLIRGYLGGYSLKPRDWSPFISHIRFNLMIVWAWTWWTWQALSQRGPRWVPVVLGLLGGWVIWKTASLTGALLLPVLAAVLLLGYLRNRWPERRNRWRLGALGCFLLLGGGVGWVIHDLKPRHPEPADYPTQSRDGEVYVHRWNRTLRENGHYVWTCVAENELAQAWQLRTGRPLSGKDGRGQNLRMTLIRYLTSVGRTKDAQGVEELTEDDVARVESGIPTINEVEKRGLARRWNVIRFEYWNYLDGGNPSGHSVIQRLAFLEAGEHILRGHLLWGVGTGDLPRAFSQAYEAIGSRLSPVFRLRAHNQFLTLWLATGPLALLLWLSWLIAAVGKPRTNRMHAFLFVLILSLSCLTEDTLETQAGVTFAGFFLALLSDRRSAAQGTQKRAERKR